ncbi:MAG TPA: hypothetical protein VJ882_06045, partial [Desulfuromonadales bacterium]|nr:hypothetical protein [Desulfuromonadales bacterium]
RRSPRFEPRASRTVSIFFPSEYDLFQVRSITGIKPQRPAKGQLRRIVMQMTEQSGAACNPFDLFV